MIIEIIIIFMKQNITFFNTFFSHTISKTLTAVLFVSGAVIVAVVDAVANIFLCDTTAITAGELSVGVARSEQTAHLVAVVSTVIIVVTAVVVGHAAPIATGKDGGLTRVEGCQSESRIGQSFSQ